MDHQRENNDVDLSGVVPERRETVRRRIAALEEYDSLRKRTWQDLVRLCEPLGLAPASFNALWRSWRNVRDPRALQGLTRPRGLRDLTGDAEFVRRTLNGMTADASIEQQVLQIEGFAAEQNVAVRSRSALRRLVREIRRETTPLPLANAPEDLIALDMVPIEIAVKAAGVTMLPLATVILHPRSGTVLFASLSLNEPSPALAASALATWLEGLPSTDVGIQTSQMLIPGTTALEWQDLFRVLNRHGVERQGPNARRLPAGLITTDALGRSLLGFETRPRMVHRQPEERRPLTRSVRINDPLSLAEAQRVVDERIAAASRTMLTVTDHLAIAVELRIVFKL